MYFNYEWVNTTKNFNNLHVAVLDSIVDHLDEVAGAILADPIATGLAVVNLGTDSLKQKETRKFKVYF